MGFAFEKERASTIEKVCSNSYYAQAIEHLK